MRRRLPTPALAVGQCWLDYGSAARRQVVDAGYVVRAVRQVWIRAVEADGHVVYETDRLREAQQGARRCHGAYFRLRRFALTDQPAPAPLQPRRPRVQVVPGAKFLRVEPAHRDRDQVFEVTAVAPTSDHPRHRATCTVREGDRVYSTQVKIPAHRLRDPGRFLPAEGSP